MDINAVLAILGVAMVALIIGGLSLAGGGHDASYNIAVQQEKEKLERERQEEEEKIKEVKKYDKTMQLQEVTLEVLDIYEQSGIKIQADILEDLSHEVFYSKKDVYNFIENQRRNWKQENTKQPYKNFK